MTLQPEQLLKEEHVRDIVAAGQYLIMYFLWSLLALIVTSIVAYVFKDTLAEWYGGISWKRDVEYRRLDTVYIYEWKEIGVIEYIATLKTAFTMYSISIKDGEATVSGGRSILIRNAELNRMHIARFKPHLGDVNAIPDFILNDLKEK